MEASACADLGVHVSALLQASMTARSALAAWCESFAVYAEFAVPGAVKTLTSFPARVAIVEHTEHDQRNQTLIQIPVLK
jgi:hypothetical protein